MKENNMKISLLTPHSSNVEPWIPVFKKLGVEIIKNDISEDCDFILCAGQAQLSLMESFHHKYPNIPLINYVWDFYKTVWEYPGIYDWKKYLDYINISKIVWCPSEEVLIRLNEEGVDTNICSIVKTWARLFEYSDSIVDGRYVLQPMRDYVGDKNFGWTRTACSELNIPLVEPKHLLSESELQKTIANCSFICTEYHEASTGGLTLLEGYNLGKPVVISDSLYMGARDYFGDKAIYFEDDSYESFKNTIKRTWENTPKLDRVECKKFISDNVPTIENMVQTMICQMEKNL